MFHRMKVAAVMTVLIGAGLAAAQAGAPGTADAGFAKLKGLVGSWTRTGGDGSVVVTYRLTAGGSAVLETLLPGSKQEMVSVYTVDRGDLVMTHYCAAGNQPHMRAAKGGEGSTIAFKFDGAGNLASPKDGHMHDMEMTFVDADHIKTTWHFYKDGKESEVESFDLTRVKG